MTVSGFLVVARHLSDTDLFIGFYPLLPDATRRWLAADFDGAQAMLDAHAYVKAAASLGVPCGLEISQSGDRKSTRLNSSHRT